MEFVCELQVTVDPAQILGNTNKGERRIIPITGGTFKGPLLEGNVLSGGADYQYANPESGLTSIEAIYTIKTNDGVLIHIRNEGLVYRPTEIPDTGTVDFSKIYFRAAPTFEAPSDSKYNWLNQAIFVCRGVPNKEYVSIQVWRVL